MVSAHCHLINFCYFLINTLYTGCPKIQRGNRIISIKDMFFSKNFAFQFDIILCEFLHSVVKHNNKLYHILYLAIDNVNIFLYVILFLFQLCLSQKLKKYVLMYHRINLIFNKLSRRHQTPYHQNRIDFPKFFFISCSLFFLRWQINYGHL